MSSDNNQKASFSIEIIPSYQFHLISPMTPFALGERKEAIVYDSFSIEGEQVNLMVKYIESSSIAGAAVLRAYQSEMVILDFYILEQYRRQGVGKALMHEIEKLAIERDIKLINTGKSLHADNMIMIEFLQKSGFIKTSDEIYYFSQPIAIQEKRIKYMSAIDYKQYLPENNEIVPFTDKYFDSVYETALEIFDNHPFFSERLIYQILLASSERYSHILVEKNMVNGFAIFSATDNNLHLNFVIIRDEYHRLGLPMFLIGAGLMLAYRDGKSTFSYIAYKEEKLFKDIRQILKEPNFVTIKMEKIIS